MVPALVIFGISTLCMAGTPYALSRGMDLLGRLFAVVGISLALTLLLLILYQDDSMQPLEPQPVSISQIAPEPLDEAPVVATP